MSRHVFVMSVLSFLLASAIGPAAAQTPPGSGRKNTSDRNERRLFQRFVEDAAVSTGGWAELQYRYTNFSNGSEHFLGPLVAFKIVNDVEAGLRFGFRDVNPDPGSGASGLSDIDLFAKYRFPGSKGRAALGILAKVPTADEEEGLGTGKSDFELFGAWRADLEAVSIVANAGVRWNGEPDPPLPPTDKSVFVGGGFILPASATLSLILEATYETERFEGASDDARLWLGVQSRRKQGRTGLRGGVAIPLSDGAPDYEVLLGLFLTY